MPPWLRVIEMGKGRRKTLQDSLGLQHPRGVWDIVVLMGVDGCLLLQGWLGVDGRAAVPAGQGKITLAQLRSPESELWL